MSQDAPKGVCEAAVQVVGGVAGDAGEFVSQGRPFADVPPLLSRRVVCCGLGLQGKEIALQGVKRSAGWCCRGSA